MEPLTAAARAVGLAVPDRISTFGLLVLGTPPKFTISARSNLHWRLAVFALEGVINLTLAFGFRIVGASVKQSVGAIPKIQGTTTFFRTFDVP